MILGTRAVGKRTSWVASSDSPRQDWLFGGFPGNALSRSECFHSNSADGTGGDSPRVPGDASGRFLLPEVRSRSAIIPTDLDAGPMSAAGTISPGSRRSPEPAVAGPAFHRAPDAHQLPLRI